MQQIINLWNMIKNYYYALDIDDRIPPYKLEPKTPSVSERKL